MLLLIAMTVLASEPRIELTCYGGGSAKRVETETGYATDDRGNSIRGQAERGVSSSYDAQLDLWVQGGSGAARLPRALLPTIRSGKYGWFQLERITTTEREISGRVAVNFANKPRFLIDRQTGRISIDGKNGRYSGDCQKREPEGRRF